jgi:hypothetical protein
VLPKPFELDCEAVALGCQCAAAAEIGSNN